MTLTEQLIEKIQMKIRLTRKKLELSIKDIDPLHSSIVLAKEDASTRPSLISRLKFSKSAFQTFNDSWNELQELYIKLEEDDSFPTEQDLTCRSRLIDFLTEAESLEVGFNMELNQSSTPNLSLNDSRIIKTSLPKINLPQFSGDINSWVPYRDKFLSIIHNEPLISQVDKFHHLLSSLSGEALTIVNQFKPTEANYTLAWEALLKNYDNNRVLANSYMEKILNFKITSPKAELGDLQAFITTVVDNIYSLRALQLKNLDDVILSYLAARTLDPATRRQFELSKIGVECPTVDELISFVRNGCLALKMTSSNLTEDKSKTTKWSKPKSVFPSRASNKYNAVLHSRSDDYNCPSTSNNYNSRNQRSCSPKNRNSVFKHEPNALQVKSPGQGTKSNVSSCRPDSKCPYCSLNHSLIRCFKFTLLNPTERLETVSKFNTCRNCLRESHFLKDCPSKLNCRFCNKRHHSLLHLPETTSNVSCTVRAELPSVIRTPYCSNGYTKNAVLCTNYASESEQVMLGTALVLIENPKKKLYPIRALLDPCSTINIITQDCIRRIGLKVDKTHVGVTGLGENPTTPLGRVVCSIHSRHDTSKAVTLFALVIPHITGQLPVRALPQRVRKQFKHLQLADPEFGEPQNIDMLIGTHIWNKIVRSLPYSVISSSTEEFPLATSTIFGEIVTGLFSETMGTSSINHHNFTFLITNIEDIQLQLKQFWELEEPKPVSRISPKDAFCEKHFQETHTRTSEGRYMVRLPFQNPPNLGNNRLIAERRFYSLERKLLSNPKLREEYISFMREYISLGHMTIAKQLSPYIIPHHGVHKGGKLRVVFDASCQSSTSSLNDQLLKGPNLIADLPDVLTNFRFNAIAVVADLVKMYRQVLLHPDDRIHQHILWIEHPSEELQEIELNTVTYGEASSAFLAIRAVRQHAADEGQNFPLARKAILNNMFVDDICSGASTPAETRQLCNELIQCFALGGFQLGKWSTNNPSALPPNIQANQDCIAIESDDFPNIKVLGLVWNPKEDVYTYSLTSPSSEVTKRSILSTIARIFDPIGFIAPIILTAKLFLQRLWMLQLGWDDEITDELKQKWLSFTDQWDYLSYITIPRYIPISDSAHFDLIGFCDASIKAYSAVIYLRLESKSGIASVQLIKAKTKVAPPKYTSIARLELCSAFLLANLYSSLCHNDRVQPDSNPFRSARRTYLFTDSKVVLDWLHTPSYQLKVFEANRISAILDVTKLENWFHIKSGDNPADLATRGSWIKDLIDQQLWWSGPNWLTSPPVEWPITFHKPISGPILHCQATSRKPCHEPEWLLRFSDVWLLLRSISRIKRFINRWKCKDNISKTKFVAPQELKEARNVCIRMVQKIAYPQGIHQSKLSSLSPFFDDLGIIRVGGRLEYASLPIGRTHPIILPQTSHLTKIIIHDLHERHFHSGVSLTLSLLRSQYWIPSASRLVKSIIRRCITCRRRNCRPLQPIMAPLPSSRFFQGRPFIHLGVDYAGPFMLRDSLRCKPLLSKAYLCLFVCFSTKALHLEAVTSLTTEAFLATLDRFISRRGLPSAFHSDNGTTFVGASNYIKDVLAFQIKNRDPIGASLALKGVQWNFIPPYSPHFGGLWEAGVKSVKRLLPAAIGGHSLTYEELATAFIKIESLLNSRPLVPLNENVDSFEALTPAHFLIGTSLKALPEEDLTDEPLSHLSRWQLVQHRIQHAWSRWKNEYLQTLQQRFKWKKPNQNISKDQLVILMEKKTPLGLWPLARVVEIHPGNDGVVRVVTLRTASGSVLRRSLSSLSPLPFPS